MASSTARLKFTPTIDEIRAAAKDVGWEYAAMLGAAVEIAKGNGTPANHFAMEAFLVHVRNLAEFFRRSQEPALKRATDDTLLTLLRLRHHMQERS